MSVRVKECIPGNGKMSLLRLTNTVSGILNVSNSLNNRQGNIFFKRLGTRSHHEKSVTLSDEREKVKEIF